MRFQQGIFFLIFCFCLHIPSSDAQQLQNPVRILTTKAGLPQSFVSALVQDSTGFIWIGTRDGLARYDGKKFKTFQHVSGDTSTLSNNTVVSLYLDKQSRLWIQYETGDIDILNTTTEALFHLTKDPVYNALYANANINNNAAEDTKGNTWLLDGNGDIFICNISKHTSRFYSQKSLHLRDNRVVGITSYNGNILLVTDKALIKVDENIKSKKTIPYTFAYPHLYHNDRRWLDAYYIVNSHKILIHDKKRFIVYNDDTKLFTDIPLPPEKNKSYFHITQDSKGQFYFCYDSTIYKLSSDNEITVYRTKEQSPAFGFTSLLMDRSGVFWAGGNGSGIYLFDTRLSHMTGKTYVKKFHEDLLFNYLNVPPKELAESFLNNIESYQFRWMEDNNGKLWLTKAKGIPSPRAQVCYYKDGHLVQPPWHYTDTAANRDTYVNVMAVSQSGKLWGMDYYLRPVYFDTLTNAVTVYPPVTKEVDVDYNYSVNSLLIDGEDQFWFTTAMNGLFQYNRKSGKTIHYFYSNKPGALPVNQLMNLVKDPSDNNILWISSLGGGLIRFNKTTGKCTAFTTREGLPNNTVYAVVEDAKGMLWCSSNKGIFLFNPKEGMIIRNFTSEDGLMGDEFNRYHFLKMPDGRIAFGGVDGYTIFNPLYIQEDNFDPKVALTGISINNSPADYGLPGSPFKSAVNSLDKIELPHDQNYLNFSFAALEYNITEKLKYRYQLESFDKGWVAAGNDNTATYTNIPPGHYTLKVNATNTTGRWSSHIRTLSLIIRPPFWRTWWAYSFYVLIFAGLIWTYIQYRVNQERMRQEVLLKQKEAIQLKAIDELKTRFFSNITHEFRTPLTLILTPAQRLKSSLQQQKHLNWIAAIERNANQLLRLINQLLDFSKLESGTLTLHETRGNICEAIEEFIRSFHEEAEKNQIQLKFTGHTYKCDYLFDADKLEQIVRNLVANALKFTKKGGTVEVSCTSKSDDENTSGYSQDSFANTVDSGIFLIIKDTGIGIPEEQLPFIFNRFYQVDNVAAGRSAASHPKGSGIGLALVKELVELQGGTINVTSSEEGSGIWKTTFSIWLPYKQATAGNPLPGEKFATKQADGLLPFVASNIFQNQENQEVKETEATVLLVEDNDELAEFIADSLPETYSISRASNGAEGFEKSTELMPDLVISDVLMPIMNGYDFCSKLKNDERINHIPVILLTAKASFDNRIEGLSLGADDYLTKPFHIKELQLRIRNLLERQRLLRDKMKHDLSHPQMPEVPSLPEPQKAAQDIFIQKLYDLVEEKLDDSAFGVLELAAAIGMSRATLHRKLKAISDLSAGDIIRNYRLNRATQYLKEGFNSSETAYKVGFESPAYFSKCFREFYNITPLEFAQQNS